MNPRFKEKVYEVVAKIPKGKVATYKQVAALAGSAGAARAVGTLMKNNPDMSKVPCHRVVGSDGAMHGYAFGEGEATKIEKLKEEGVRFRDALRVDLEASGW